MKKRYPFLPKNYFRLWLLIISASFFSFGLQGQNVPTKQWEKTFGTQGSDNFQFIKPTTDGGFIIGGIPSRYSGSNNSQETEKGWSPFWIINIDSSGNKQWDRILTTNTHNWFSFLHQTSEGGYILGGRYSPFIKGEQEAKYELMKVDDVRVIKLDADGIKEWEKICGVIQERNSKPVLQLATDGSFILGGSYKTKLVAEPEKNAEAETNFWMIKLDAKGNETWRRTIGGNYADKIPIFIATPEGGIVIGGTFLSNITSDQSKTFIENSDLWLIKLDSFGNKLWEKKGGGNDNEILSTIKLTPDGGYVLEGTSYSEIGSNKSKKNKKANKIWVVKMNSEGDTIYNKSFPNLWGQIEFPLLKTSEGEYLLLARFQKKYFSGIKIKFGSIKFIHLKFSGKYHRVKLPFRIKKKYYTKTIRWVVKVDSSGNKQWANKYNAKKAWLFGFLPTEEGDIFFMEQDYSRGEIYGRTNKPKPHKTRLFKINSQGKEVWSEIITENEGKAVRGVRSTKDGGLIIGGDIYPFNQPIAKDFWIIKYGPKKK